MAITDASKEVVGLAQQALAGRLAQDFAHQANNLLVGIVSVDDVLEHNTVADMRRALTTSAECGRRIAELVRAFQQSFGSFDFTASPTGVDIGAVLDGALVLCQIRAGWHGVAIEADYRNLPNVRGNAVALAGAFIGLICEILDGLGDGGMLRISGRANDGLVRVEVQGIPSAGLSGGGRSLSGTPGEHKKSGNHPSPAAAPEHCYPMCSLGLTAARLVLEGYGGSLAADRVPEQGVRFTVVLPFDTGRAMMGVRQEQRDTSRGFGKEVPGSSRI